MAIQFNAGHSVLSADPQLHSRRASAESRQNQLGVIDAKTAAKTPQSDTVTISESYRQRMREALGIDGKYMIRPLDPDAGVTAENLVRYADAGAGAGNLNLKILDSNRVDLSSRIETALSAKGIKLSADEKLYIAVDNDNKFTVAGIKDKKKAKEIANALNEDEKLGLAVRKHFAAAKSLKQSRDVAKAASGGPEYQKEIIEALTDPGMCAFVLDNYLQDLANIGLADLGVEKDEDGNSYLTNVDGRLAAAFDTDEDLLAAVKAAVESGEKGDFQVAFQYANGMISDTHVEDEAREGAKTIYDLISSKVAEFNDLIREEEEEANGGAWDPENSQVISHFTIQIGAGGDVEIVGAENLTDRQERALHQAVVAALRDYDEIKKGNDQFLERSGRDAVSQMPGIDDIVNAFVNQHQFEHGDTKEYQHVLQLASGSMGPKISVASPQADAATEETIRTAAGDFGKALRVELEKQGVDVGDGIEVEMDSSGKMRVKGDLTDPNLRQAQSILDRMAKEMKAADHSPERQQTDDDLLKGRGNLLERGLGDYGDHAETDDLDERASWRDGLPYVAVLRPEKQDEEEGKRRIHSMSHSKQLSDAKPPRSDLVDPTAEGTEDLALQNRFADNDLGLMYARLKDLFNQYHDGGKGRTVTFVIA